MIAIASDDWENLLFLYGQPVPLAVPFLRFDRPTTNRRSISLLSTSSSEESHFLSPPKNESEILTCCCSLSSFVCQLSSKSRLAFSWRRFSSRSSWIRLSALSCVVVRIVWNRKLEGDRKDRKGKMSLLGFYRFPWSLRYTSWLAEKEVGDRMMLRYSTPTLVPLGVGFPHGAICPPRGHNTYVKIAWCSGTHYAYLGPCKLWRPPPMGPPGHPKGHLKSGQGAYLPISVFIIRSPTMQAIEDARNLFFRRTR